MMNLFTQVDAFTVTAAVNLVALLTPAGYEVLVRRLVRRDPGVKALSPELEEYFVKLQAAAATSSPRPTHRRLRYRTS